MFDFDEDLLAARAERKALWAACCRGAITYAELLVRVKQLHAMVGDALYSRPGRG
jgi:hypothetical protein